MMRRKDVIIRMGAVHREHKVAAIALSAFENVARHDAMILIRSGVDGDDLRRCRSSLEATYLVRIFAVFEAGLREVWAISFQRASHPKTQDLLDGCSARQSISDEILARAHRVRTYRNSLLHGGRVKHIPLDDVHSWLARFFGRMPSQW